eukprot:6854940-Prymnesium_polylepis.1
MQVGAALRDDFERRVPRYEVEAVADAVRSAAWRALRRQGVSQDECAAAVEAVACGSYRRGKADSGDVD